MNQSTMRVGLASVAEVDKVWPLISEGIQKSCDRGTGELCAGQLWQMCRSGNAFLCLVYDDDKIHMASVWRFEEHIRGHAFHCLTLYGSSLRTWFEQSRDFIIKIAKDNGANRVTACGRKGWVRMFNMSVNGDTYEVEI